MAVLDRRTLDDQDRTLFVCTGVYLAGEKASADPRRREGPAMVTMTWVGLDVHARSIEAAALDVASGELTRRRFAGESQAVVDWLARLSGPVAACYEAGPTGYGLYRAAQAAGIAMQVVAPSKTPRAAGDRVKTDRKDAELRLRLLAAGALTAVSVPPSAFEAARDLTRAREQLRGDLMRARHRVSKLLLRYGRVWDPGRSAWTVAHRRWLAGQAFEEQATELAYLDALGAIDALAARKAALDEQLGRLASDPRFCATVGSSALLSRPRHPLGARFAPRGPRLVALRSARRAGRLGRAHALPGAVRRESHERPDRQDRLRLCPPHPGRGRPPRRQAALPLARAWPPLGRPAGRRACPRLARPGAPLPDERPPAGTRQAGQRGRGGGRPRAGLLSLGGRPDRVAPPDSPPRSGGRRRADGLPARANELWATPAGPRPFLEQRLGRRRSSVLG